MKKFIYTAFSVLLMSLFWACTDDRANDDPEEPFEDPIPLEELGESIVKFNNPVIYSDVPDPSVVRVGSDYYMVSTSMHLVPGGAILHSTDLVGWEIVGYVFDKLEGSPAANFEYDDAIGRNDIYSQGSWASSLAYHNGKFYCLWNTYGFGNNTVSYISSATNPAGPWTMEQRMDRLYYDASLFFDDDDKAYIIAAHGETITLLNPDLSPSPTVYTFTTGGYEGEGYQVRKVDGNYYIFMMCWPTGSVRSVVCLRATNISGPYTARMVLSSKIGDGVGNGVSQGCIVDTPEGNWYGLFFTDLGAVGRCPVLTQCRWENGWPMLGDKNGKIEAETISPLQNSRFSTSTVVKSDEFDASKLDLIWQWNHNPSPNHWSLTSRPGYLRLTTGHVATDYYHARNTLTCRTMGSACRGEVAMDVSLMKDGDRAGLSMMQYQSGLVGVKKENGSYFLFMSDGKQNGVMTERASVEINQTTVYLRVVADFDTEKARFYYSLKGYDWIEIGNEMTMVYDLLNFVGNRFAIFNYATKQTGGKVDVDYFRFKRM
jgi:arabinoxylan arabinofuranohydrolase